MRHFVEAIFDAKGNEKRAVACLDAARAVSGGDPVVVASLIQAAATYSLAAATEEAQERVRAALVNLGPV